MREELMKKLEELKERLFRINMVDHWTWEDRELYYKTTEEIRTIEAALA